ARASHTTRAAQTIARCSVVDRRTAAGRVPGPVDDLPETSTSGQGIDHGMAAPRRFSLRPVWNVRDSMNGDRNRRTTDPGRAGREGGVAAVQIANGATGGIGSPPHRDLEAAGDFAPRGTAVPTVPALPRRSRAGGLGGPPRMR